MKGGPKSSLRPFLHRALQLLIGYRKTADHKNTDGISYLPTG